MSAARSAEVLGALSLATDASAGFPPETAVRTALVAVRIARALDVSPASARDAYYTGLLRFLGCTAVAHEVSALAGGDDLAFLQTYADVDLGDPLAVMGRTVRRLGSELPLAARARAVVAFLSDPKGGDKVSSAHCELAASLATRLGMGEAVTEALAQMYERWDGRGAPRRLAGDELSLVARVVHVAHVAEVFTRTRGVGEASRELERRSGKHFAPDLVKVAARALPEVARDLGASVWDAFLEEEPLPRGRIEADQRLEVARAFATFVDVKSPFTVTHSTRVAAVARDALLETGAPAAAAAELEQCALLHDLGRVAIPNGIWDKPGKLNAAEWERARGHSAGTERVLAQSALLRPLAELAADAHERCDGSGYPRRARAGDLSLAARILAASDVFVALQEDRAHRRAIGRDAAAALLTGEVAGGRLCPIATAAVLAAGGHQAKVAPRYPNELTPREVDVLCLVAQGLTNKEIAARLALSPRTVQTHLAHVFDKTGTRTRSGVATFASSRGIYRAERA